jgi:hypothetical protein
MEPGIISCNKSGKRRMKMKKMKYVLITASMMLLVGAASAELLGAWMDGSVDYAAEGAPSVAPAVSGVTTGNLNEDGLGWEIRDSFGAATPSGPTYSSGASSFWALARAANTQSSMNNADYFSLSVTADAGKQLDMDTLTFDATMVRNDTGTINATIGIYISTNGLTYSLFDSSETLSHVDPTDPEDTFLAPTTISYDISSFTGVDEFRVRIAFADDSGSGGKGTWLQGIQLNGSVIPEPATIGLFGMAAAGMLFIRRIMM